ncbi:MAG: hypothetical protein WC788_04955 [Candidatus Paceibacterota bacterium]|jgi:hypothetical protein
MIIPSAGGNKIKLVIFLILMVFASAGVFYFQKYYFSKDEKPAYAVEITAEKGVYVRGEQVKFIVTNKGTRPVWYIVPPGKCKNDLQWDLFFEEEGSWSAVYKHPKCEIVKEDYDFIEIKNLGFNESVNGVWDQKLYSEGAEGRYAGPGKYRIVFYYSDEIINKNDIRSETDPGMKNSYSVEFEIADDFYDDFIRSEVQKENDRERKDDLSEIKKALGAYSPENGRKFPESNGLIRLNDKNSDVYLDLLKYTKEEFLSDPNQPEYYYGYGSSGFGFELSARLENIEDGSCEMIGGSICIYKIDSLGNISQRKYEKQRVVTPGETVDVFFEKLKVLDSDKNIIMITSDMVGGEERAIISQVQPPENVKVKKAGEVTSEDLSQNNLVLSGSPDTNSIIAELNRKIPVVDIADLVDIEKNDITGTFKYSKNPWNNEKIVIVFETGYSMEAVTRIKGVLKAEKTDEFYHVVLDLQDGGAYAVVSGFIKDGAMPQSLVEYDGKNVEVYGYKRMRNSKEFPIEESIGAIDISILD